jgi:hypothetical protein
MNFLGILQNDINPLKGHSYEHLYENTPAGCLLAGAGWSSEILNADNGYVSAYIEPESAPEEVVQRGAAFISGIIALTGKTVVRYNMMASGFTPCYKCPVNCNRDVIWGVKNKYKDKRIIIPQK